MNTTHSRTIALQATVDEAVGVSTALHIAPVESTIAALTETMQRCVTDVRVAMTSPVATTLTSEKKIQIWLRTNKGSWG